MTFDDVNLREWLDLSETRLALFAGTTLDERYEHAILEARSGERFDGFTPAISSDLLALADSAGINVTASSVSINGASVRDLIALVGVSYGPSASDSVASFGLLEDYGPSTPVLPGSRLAGRLEYFPLSGAFGQAKLIIAPGVSDLATAGNTGVWLFRAVPEPASFWLSLSGVALLKARKRMHSNRAFSADRADMRKVVLSLREWTASRGARCLL